MAETVGLLIFAGIEAIGVTGAATAATFTFGATGISLATAVGAAAIVGASIGLQYATRPDVPKPENGSQPLKQGVPPRIMGYGRNRLAGFYMLFEAVNRVSYDVHAFHSGRVDGIINYYFNDDPVSIDGSGHPIGWGDRYNFTTVVPRLGATPEAPYGFPELGSVWGANFRGDGIASFAVILSSTGNPSDFTKRFPQGYPQVSVVADCAPIFDPWDVTQVRSNPLTWKVSANPVLQLIDYLTRVDGGLGLDYNTLFPPERLAQWATEAGLCNQVVARADGTLEPRYQSNGWFYFDNKPEDVINSILATCDGWLCEAGDGTLSLKVGVYREPTITIEERHFLGGFSLNYGQADESTVNQLEISFTDPAQKYVETQVDPYRDEEAISESGVLRSQKLDLKWVQSATQAYRLADRAMQRVSPTMTGSFTTSLVGLKALGERWVRLQYPFISGLQDCVIEVQGVEVDLIAGRCTFNFNRIAPDQIEAYDPTIDEGRLPVIPVPGGARPLNAAATTVTSDSNLYTADYA